MSKSREVNKNLIIKQKNKKNSQFNDYKLISYKEREKKDLYDWMRKGYEEMASINLNYAEENSIGLYDELIEYETWLCGV